MVDRAEHCFLFDSHYALATSHWQQLVVEGKKFLVVMEALKCPVPVLNNGEDNAVSKSLIGTLIKCPGPGHCADPLISRARFFQVIVPESCTQTTASELPHWIDHDRFAPYWLSQEKRIQTTCPQPSAADCNGKLGVQRLRFSPSRQSVSPVTPREHRCRQILFC